MNYFSELADRGACRLGVRLGKALAAVVLVMPLLIAPVTAQAADTPSPAPATSTPGSQPATPGSPLPKLGLTDLKGTFDREGNSVDVSFKATNPSDASIGSVYFEVSLEVNRGKYGDRYVQQVVPFYYSLDARQSRDFSYTAKLPQGVPSGTYTLRVQAKNQSTIALAGAFARVEIQGDGGMAEFHWENSRVIAKTSTGRDYGLLEGPSVAIGDPVKVRTELANPTSSPITLVPSLAIYDRNETPNAQPLLKVMGDPISLAAGETKQATFSLPDFKDPGSYLAHLEFVNQATKKTATPFAMVRWVLKGESGRILSVSSRLGDATWSKQSVAVDISAVGPADATVIPSAKLEVSIAKRGSKEILATSVFPIANLGPNPVGATLPLSLSRLASVAGGDFTVTASLLGSHDKILNSTSSDLRITVSRNILPWMAGGAMLLIGLAALFMRMHRRGRGVVYVGMILCLLAASVFGTSASKAFASCTFVGSNDPQCNGAATPQFEITTSDHSGCNVTGNATALCVTNQDGSHPVGPGFYSDLSASATLVYCSNSSFTTDAQITGDTCGGSCALTVSQDGASAWCYGSVYPHNYPELHATFTLTGSSCWECSETVVVQDYPRWCNTDSTTNQTSSSQTTNSQTTNSQTTNSQTTNSQTTNSQTTNSQTTNSQTTNSQTTNSQTTNSQTTNSQTTNSQTTTSPSPSTDQSSNQVSDQTTNQVTTNQFSNQVTTTNQTSDQTTTTNQTSSPPPTNQTSDQTTTTNQTSTNQTTTNQTSNQTTNQVTTTNQTSSPPPTNQTSNQTTTTTNQATDQATNQLTDQATNQTSDQTTNQVSNQTTTTNQTSDQTTTTNQTSDQTTTTNQTSDQVTTTNQTSSNQATTTNQTSNQATTNQVTNQTSNQVPPGTPVLTPFCFAT